MNKSIEKPIKTIPKTKPIIKESIFKAEIVDVENDKQLSTIKEDNKIAPKEINITEGEINKLHLGSLDGCQRSIARVCNLIFQNKIDNKKARTLVFALRCMLESWRVKGENSIIMLEKIERLEKIYKHNSKAENQ